MPGTQAPPATTDCLDCNGSGMRDSGGTHPWGEAALVPCDCAPLPSYGYECASDGTSGRGCDAKFEGGPGAPAAEVEQKAGAAGWRIGHLNGQARIVCPGCTDLIQNARPLATPLGQAHHV